jgi:hypothetical protein
MQAHLQVTVARVLLLQQPAVDIGTLISTLRPVCRENVRLELPRLVYLYAEALLPSIVINLLLLYGIESIPCSYSMDTSQARRRHSSC